MFRELFTDTINEKLRIVKKSDGFDKRDVHITKVHKGEIEHSKMEMDPLLIGYIGDIKIIKSKHATEIRDGDKFDRSYNIDNEAFLDIFRKLFLKPKFRPRTKTAVVYKNLKGKWDLMIVNLTGKVLTIITVIKKNERAPFDAKASSKHKEQPNIIVEHTLNGQTIHKIEEFITIY